jgi:hypothetical protein
MLYLAKLDINYCRSKGNIHKTNKIWVKIGRLKEKHGSTAANYEIQLQPSNSAPQKIESLIITDQHQKSCKAEFPGCYVIETNYQISVRKRFGNFI